jgi:hypothetical protein
VAVALATASFVYNVNVLLTCCLFVCLISLLKYTFTPDYCDESVTTFVFACWNVSSVVLAATDVSSCDKKVGNSVNAVMRCESVF